MAFPPLETIIEPVRDAVEPLLDPLVDAGTGVGDTLGDAARGTRDAIVTGLGIAFETLGIDEALLEALTGELRAGIEELLTAAATLRSVLATMQAMVPSVEAVIQAPLPEKFSAASRTTMTAAAQQAWVLAGAIVTVCRAMRHLIATHPTLTDQLRRRFGAWCSS